MIYNEWFRDISIHALREEGDNQILNSITYTEYISIHALREEGDNQILNSITYTEYISIHALREEGDGCGLDWNVSIYQFLSTPSARRATTSGR